MLPYYLRPPAHYLLPPVSQPVSLLLSTRHAPTESQKWPFPFVSGEVRGHPALESVTFSSQYATSTLEPSTSAGMNLRYRIMSLFLADFLEGVPYNLTETPITKSSSSSETQTNRTPAATIGLIDVTSAASTSRKATSSTSTRLPGTESSITASPSAQSSASNVAVPRTHGLERQTRIAIGVAVPVVVILITVILILWIKLSKRRNQHPSRSGKPQE